MARSGAGNGLASPNSTASSISVRAASAIASASSAESVPSLTSRARKRGTGSPRFAASYSSTLPKTAIASCSGVVERHAGRRDDVAVGAQSVDERLDERRPVARRARSTAA